MGWCAAHRACAYSAIASATSMTLSEILRRRELIVSLCGSATAVARGAMLRRIACEGWASTAFVKSRLRAMASFPISVQLAPNPYGVFYTNRAGASLIGCFGEKERLFRVWWHGTTSQPAGNGQGRG